MTKGALLPVNNANFTTYPVIMAPKIPAIYKLNTINALFCGKKAAANTANIAKRAPQDINGAIMMVIKRSRRVSNVLVAMTDGTLQPKPTISGTKALPGKPIACIKRSMTYAARAI